MGHERERNDPESNSQTMKWYYTSTYIMCKGYGYSSGPVVPRPSRVCGTYRGEAAHTAADGPEEEEEEEEGRGRGRVAHNVMSLRLRGAEGLSARDGIQGRREERNGEV